MAQGTREKKPDGEQGSLRREVSAAGKGKGVPADPDVQTRGSAKKKVKEMKYGSKKLWNTLFPPSSIRQHGSRSCSEPILLGKPSSNREEILKEEAFGARAQKERGASASPIFFCRSTRNRKWGLEEGASSASGEKAARKSLFEEDREGFLGRVGFDLHGPSVTFLPSSPEIRGKGLNFLGNCGLSVAENVEVISSASSQSPLSSFPISSGSAPPLPLLSPSAHISSSSVFQSPFPLENRVIPEFLSKNDDDGSLCQNCVGNLILVEVESQPVCSNLLPKRFNPFKSKPKLPSEVSNLVTVSQGDDAVSPSGEFQIEGLSPRKMAKMLELLSSLDIKVYSRRKSRRSIGL